MFNFFDNFITPESISGFDSIIMIGIIIIWIYAVLWTVRDIYARSDNTLFQIFCFLLVLIGTPIIGLPIYLLIRPLSLKEELIGRQTLVEMESVICGSCMRPNLIGHDHCVFCGSTLKIQCKNCKEMYPHTHHYCFKCGAPNLTLKD